MSLTQGNQLYAALSQGGFQKLVHSIYLARPHYFNYATQALGGGAPNVSLLSPILVGGGSLDYSLQFSEPTMLFYPLTDGAQFPLPVAANQFALTTAAKVCISEASQALSWIGLLRKPGSPVATAPPPQLVCAALDIAAVGEPVSRPSGSDTLISLHVTAINVDGADQLDPLIEYILQIAINSLLFNVFISASSLAQGAFAIVLKEGPEISDQSLEIWADVA